MPALLLLLGIVIGTGLAQGKELKRDPNTGVIRVLYVGAPFMPSPYLVFKTDPLLSPTPVQANQYALPMDVIKKAMRVYMPRTRESLVEKYDVVGLDDTSCANFRPETLHWMADACREDGLGMFMGGGFESFGGNVGFSSWGDTVIGEVMPVECVQGQYSGGRNVITDFEDEFMRSVPWDDYDRYSVFCGHNVVTTKQQAHEVSHIEAPGRDDPCWVWWDIGNGRFFASAGGFRGVSGWCQFYQWKHYSDMVCNLQYFLAGLTPPADLELLHATRARFQDCYSQRQVLVSTLDFIAIFNADTREVDLKILRALESLNEAKRRFVDLDLQASKELADRAFQEFEEAYQVALRAKDAAIFWIFVSEWLVVSATAMICASALWTLMVKRRLYREVEFTRGGIRIA